MPKFRFTFRQRLTILWLTTIIRRELMPNTWNIFKRKTKGELKERRSWPVYRCIYIVYICKPTSSVCSVSVVLESLGEVLPFRLLFYKYILYFVLSNRYILLAICFKLLRFTFKCYSYTSMLKPIGISR